MKSKNNKSECPKCGFIMERHGNDVVLSKTNSRKICRQCERLMRYWIVAILNRGMVITASPNYKISFSDLMGECKWIERKLP